jgi:hypothetical protein
MACTDSSEKLGSAGDKLVDLVMVYAQLMFLIPFDVGLSSTLLQNLSCPSYS